MVCFFRNGLSYNDYTEKICMVGKKGGMMRKFFSIILLLVFTISLTACGGKNSEEKLFSEPIYEVTILDSVPTTELVDTFSQYGKQFFIGSYKNIIYTEFHYEGDFDSLEIVNGDMTLIYLATNTSGLIDSSIKLAAKYDKSNRHVTYYRLDTNESSPKNPSPISSARFSEVVEKMKGYFGNLDISSGYIEMTEYALDGQWIINHFPDEGKYADIQLIIDSTTLELLEYNQNP